MNILNQAARLPLYFVGIIMIFIIGSKGTFAQQKPFFDFPTKATLDGNEYLFTQDATGENKFTVQQVANYTTQYFDNLYSSDGTLTSPRSILGSNQPITWNNLSTFGLNESNFDAISNVANGYFNVYYPNGSVVLGGGNQIAVRTPDIISSTITSNDGLVLCGISSSGTAAVEYDSIGNLPILNPTTNTITNLQTALYDLNNNGGGGGSDTNFGITNIVATNNTNHNWSNFYFQLKNASSYEIEATQTLFQRVINNNYSTGLQSNGISGNSQLYSTNLNLNTNVGYNIDSDNNGGVFEYYDENGNSLFFRQYRKFFNYYNISLVGKEALRIDGNNSNKITFNDSHQFPVNNPSVLGSTTDGRSKYVRYTDVNGNNEGWYDLTALHKIKITGGTATVPILAPCGGGNYKYYGHTYTIKIFSDDLANLSYKLVTDKGYVYDTIEIDTVIQTPTALEVRFPIYWGVASVSVEITEGIFPALESYSIEIPSPADDIDHQTPTVGNIANRFWFTQSRWHDDRKIYSNTHVLTKVSSAQKIIPCDLNVDLLLDGYIVYNIGTDQRTKDLSSGQSSSEPYVWNDNGTIILEPNGNTLDNVTVVYKFVENI